jgi:hypothetical protein
MTKTMLRTAALALTVLMGMTVGARNASATDKTTTGTVGSIVVGNKSISFFLTGSPALCNSVTQSGGSTGWVTVNETYFNANSVKNILSLVTAAKLAGHKISVRGLNNTTAGEFGCRTDGIDML